VVLKGLLGGYEEVPFKGDGGCEVWFVVGDCEDRFRWSAEGAFVQVDLETFCRSNY
jgi:hypothetical protein